MSTLSDRPYTEETISQQAEKSTANPADANVQFRILIELQLHSMLFAQAFEITEDLSTLRRDIAASIT